MEALKKILEQHPQRLPGLLPESSAQTDKISLYRGELTAQTIVAEASKIKKAFPALPAGFYDVFATMIKEDGFCDARLRDAVNHVIRTCIYPTPTIAQFISFDKTVPHRNYEQMCKEALTYDGVWKEWLAIKYPELPMVVWVHANDVVKYKLETYLVNKQTHD